MLVRPAAAIFLSIVLSVASAHADFYKYTDSSGAVCITDKKDSIPARYRAKAVVIKEEALEKRDAGKTGARPERQDAIVPSPSAQEYAVAPDRDAGEDGLLGRYPWAKPLLVIGGLTMAFVLVLKVSAAMPSPLLGRLILLSFFLAVFVLGFKLYGDYMSESYFSIKGRMTGMIEKSSRREAPDGASQLPKVEN